MGILDKLFGDGKEPRREDLAIEIEPAKGKVRIEVDVQKDVVDPVFNIFDRISGRDSKRK